MKTNGRQKLKKAEGKNKRDSDSELISEFWAGSGTADVGEAWSHLITNTTSLFLRTYFKVIVHVIFTEVNASFALICSLTE